MRAVKAGWIAGWIAGRRAGWLAVALCLAAAPPLAAAAEPEAKTAAADRATRMLGTYQKMLEEDPDHAWALAGLLKVSHVVGGVAGLITRYEARLAKKPGDYPSLMVLGHLHRAAEHVARAAETYGRAATIKPKDPAPHLAVAELQRRAQAWEAALAAYDKAIALLKKRAPKQDALRDAAEVALEAGQLERANGYFDKRVKTEPGNLLLRMENASIMARLEQEAEALTMWEAVRKSAKGNLKHLVLVWREVGDLQERLGRLAEAEKTFRRGMERTPAAHWAHKTFIEGLIGLYRRQDKLRDLIAELEPKARANYDMLLVVGRLYEEIADDDKALAVFRDAVRRRPNDERARKRMIVLLERIGPAKDVIKAYEGLMRSAPGEPRNGLRLAELYFHQGDKKKGFQLLRAASRRFSDDPGVHQAVIDLTMRFGDKKERSRIEPEYRLLMRIEPNEESHVISLGEFYWSDNKRAKALATWKRLLRMGRSKGEGHHLLAEVYADHDMMAEAAQQFRAALDKEPKNPMFAKAYAAMLEKQRNFKGALTQWEKVLDQAGSAVTTTGREARRRIIALWEKDGRLEREIDVLKKRFEADPTRLEEGHFLVAAYLRKRQLEAARLVLEQLRKVAPKHVETLVGLEMVYTRQNELRKAIDVLEQLARANTKAAFDYLHRAANLALSLGEDQQALRFMRRVVALNPADPQAHSRVGELYQRMGQLAQAAEAWRQALLIDGRNRKVQFKLASVYRDMGKLLREEQVLSDIVREARDPGHVLKAGRRLLQVAVTTGRLEAVEEVLRPLAYARRDKDVFLRLIVDLYGLLSQEISYSSLAPEAREQALRAVGDRGIKPLLDALVSPDVAVRARALDVLRLTKPAGAAPALGRLIAESDNRVSFQSAAVLGFVGSEAAVGALKRLLTAKSRPMRSVAIWSLGRISGGGATKELVELLTRGDASLRAQAALALGRKGDMAALERLTALARPGGGNHEQQVAATWALGRLAAPASVPALRELLLSAPPAEVERLAVWGLGRIGTTQARDALVGHLWGGGRGGAGLAARALAALQVRDDATVDKGYDALVDYNKASMQPNPAPLYAVSRPPRRREADVAKQIEPLREPLTAAVGRLLAVAGDAAGELLRGTLGDDSHLQLAPLAGPSVGTEELVRGLFEPHTAALLALASGGSPDSTRAAAVEVVARLDPSHERARRLGLDALEARDTALARAGARALGIAGQAGDAAAVAAVIARLERAQGRDQWLLRTALAEALGRLGTAKGQAALVVLLSDGFPTVREVAATASREQLQADIVRAAVITLLDDPVPDVANAAAAALETSEHPAAQRALSRHRPH